MPENEAIHASVAGELPGLRPGDVFWKRYRVISVIGKGGVSTVYKAEDSETKQLVAIKVLHAHRTREKELVQRFVREAQTTARLDHPHAIKIYEWGVDEHDRPFMIIEFLAGETLSKRIQKSNGLAWSKAVEIMEQICAAVAEAHALGIVHRDLKPENIMLVNRDGREDFVKVVDFGIAKLEPTEDGESVAAANITQAGAILGTPLYMSPEQLRGRKADARSDIYSLGVIMYEMLTGAPPFASKKTAEIVVGHLNVTPEAPPRRRLDLNIPERLGEAVMRALSKEPWERPTTVAEFADSLHKATVDRAEFVTSRQPSSPSLPKVPAAPAPGQLQGAHSTPSGVGQLRRVCPKCEAVASDSNFRYCLRCGQDNTNRWVPLSEDDGRKRSSPRVRLPSRNHVRVVVLAALLLLLALWSLAAALTPTNLEGEYTAVFDHQLFADNKHVAPALAKKLALSRVKMSLAQDGELVSGTLETGLGPEVLTGTAVNLSPMLVAYELSSVIDAREGKLDIEMAGTFDKVLRKSEWSVRAFFQGPRSKPVAEFAGMELVPAR